MGNITERIKAAHSILRLDLHKKGITEITIEIVERNWIQLYLADEDRSLWISYQSGFGYFYTWDREDGGNSYFQLNSDTFRRIPELLGASTAEPRIKKRTADQVGELLSSLNDSEPDPERIRRLLDEIPYTEAGIDILATVASIKYFRIIIEKLKSLINSQETSKHSEKKYQKILASNPWMLGSQYTELIVEEFFIDTNARVDLMLASAIGHVDVVELKRPDTKIVTRGTRSDWRYSHELSDTQSQANKYLDILDANGLKIASRHPFVGQSVSRLYRSGVIIVAGRTPNDRDALNLLRRFNTTDPRILLLTYDDIIAIAEATISIFETKLAREAR